MVELRMLETHIASLQQKTKPGRRIQVSPGEEACRVNTLLDLQAADLVFDAQHGIAAPFLRGEALPSILHRISSPDADLRGTTGVAPAIPFISNARDRLTLAMGAAMALQQQASLQPQAATRKKPRPIVLGFAYSGEITIAEWKPLLRQASTQRLPILFVVLPTAAVAKPGTLSLAASGCGVPGIPVDADDAVALYRVAQESSLRARSGGGPVLMECIPFRVQGTNGSKSQRRDSIDSLGQSMLERKLVTQQWLTSVETGFAKKLQVAAQS